MTAEDHPAVLKVLAERHRDLARLRSQVACRLHAVLCDLVPGGISKEISAAQAATILGQVTPSGPVELARAERLQADARKAAAHAKGPGGQPGNDPAPLQDPHSAGRRGRGLSRAARFVAMC